MVAIILINVLPHLCYWLYPFVSTIGEGSPLLQLTNQSQSSATLNWVMHLGERGQIHQWVSSLHQISRRCSNHHWWSCTWTRTIGYSCWRSSRLIWVFHLTHQQQTRVVLPWWNWITCCSRGSSWTVQILGHYKLTQSRSHKFSNTFYAQCSTSLGNCHLLSNLSSQLFSTRNRLSWSSRWSNR